MERDYLQSLIELRGCFCWEYLIKLERYREDRIEGTIIYNQTIIKESNCIFFKTKKQKTKTNELSFGVKKKKKNCLLGFWLMAT